MKKIELELLEKVIYSHKIIMEIDEEIEEDIAQDSIEEIADEIEANPEKYDRYDVVRLFERDFDDITFKEDSSPSVEYECQ